MKTYTKEEAKELVRKLLSAYYGYNYSVEWGYDAEKDWKELVKIEKLIIKGLTREKDAKAS